MRRPTSMRNGLKWRAGKPRWEPSPASRALKISGRDLKDLNGQWITDRGLAITLADARHTWARLLRDAHGDDAAGNDARQLLRAALDALNPPSDDMARLKRDNVADLIEKGRALTEARPEQRVSMRNGRRVADLIDAYFADPPMVAAKTLKAYRVQSQKFRQRFGADAVTSLTRGMIYSWSQELSQSHSLATANQAIGAAGAMLTWAARHDWISHNPATKLGLTKAAGRLVFWPFAMEQAFVVWCDTHGWPDVADAVTYGCWTGARQVDMCLANVGDLSGQVWRFTPQKTRRKGLDAVPGIMPAVAARVAVRREACRLDGVRYIKPGDAPLLWDPRDGRRHDSDSIGKAFTRARTAVIMAAARDPSLAALDGLSERHLQDTRDTCVTRLFAAGIKFDDIAPWSGHSKRSIERILREHYICVLDEGAMETARQYQEWAATQGFSLGT